MVNDCMDVTEIIEGTSRLAQKYLSERPAIILGSGSSIPYGLPGMKRLGESLISEIDIQKQDKLIWNKFIDEFQSSHDLEKSLNSVYLPDTLLKKVVNVIWQIINLDDLIAYEKALENKNYLSLSKLFRYLLRVSNPVISVITTNYDRLAEYAADNALAQVYTGFSSGWIQHKVDRPRTRETRQIQIWKVHGSLDWFQNQSSEVIGLPLRQSIPNNHRPVIVTPGITKYQQSHLEPFRTVMTNADNVLANATSFFCLGYGFNDEHVQPKILSRIRTDDIPLVIITRTLSESVNRLLLENPTKKFLFIEKYKEGSRIYSPTYPSGISVEIKKLWCLEKFLEEFIEPGGNK